MVVQTGMCVSSLDTWTQAPWPSPSSGSALLLSLPGNLAPASPAYRRPPGEEGLGGAQNRGDPSRRICR